MTENLPPSSEAAPGFSPERKSPIKHGAFLPSVPPSRIPRAWERQPRMPFAQTAKFRRVWKRYDFRTATQVGKRMKDRQPLSLQGYRKRSSISSSQASSPSTPHRAVKKLRLGNTDGQGLESGRHCHSYKGTLFDYKRNRGARKTPKPRSMDSPFEMLRANGSAPLQNQAQDKGIEISGPITTKCDSPPKAVFAMAPEKTRQTFDFPSHVSTRPKPEGYKEWFDGTEADEVECLDAGHAALPVRPPSLRKELVPPVKTYTARFSNDGEPATSLDPATTASWGEATICKGPTSPRTPRYRSPRTLFHPVVTTFARSFLAMVPRHSILRGESTSTLCLSQVACPSNIGSPRVVRVDPFERGPSGFPNSAAFTIEASSRGRNPEHAYASRCISTGLDGAANALRDGGRHSFPRPKAPPADNTIVTQPHKANRETDDLKLTNAQSTVVEVDESTGGQNELLRQTPFGDVWSEEQLISLGVQGGTIDAQDNAAFESYVKQSGYKAEDVPVAVPSMLDAESHLLGASPLSTEQEPELDSGSAPGEAESIEGVGLIVTSPTLRSLPLNLATLSPHDDAEMLKDFLTRAKASKAARIAMVTSASYRRDSDAVRLALAKPDQTGILANLDINSPSPRNLAPEDQDPSDEHPTPTKDVTLCEASTVTSPSTRESMGQEEPGPVPAARRSMRSRLPLSRNPKPSSPPNRIPVRRAIAAEPLVLQKTEAQELALLTRTNTRRNKGGALPAAVMLVKLRETKGEDEEESHGEERDAAVKWDDRLAYFEEKVVDEAEREKEIVDEGEVGLAKGQSEKKARMRPVKSSSRATPAKGFAADVACGGTFLGTTATGVRATGNNKSVEIAGLGIAPEQEPQTENRTLRARKQILPTPTPTSSKNLKLKLGAKTVAVAVVAEGKENKENKPLARVSMSGTKVPVPVPTMDERRMRMRGAGGVVGAGSVGVGVAAVTNGRSRARQ